jgi:uncharacterized membrane protein YtjA (UPF0391 family)
MCRNPIRVSRISPAGRDILEIRRFAVEAYEWHVYGTLEHFFALSDHQREGNNSMLKWALIFLVISLISGFLGFSGISAATAGIAKILFFIFLVVFLIFVVLAFAAGNAIL